MKLVTYVRRDDATPSERLGALGADETHLVDLQAASVAQRGKASASFDDMVALLSGGEAARVDAQALVAGAAADCSVALSGVKLLAPVPRPRMMRDTACYEGHLVNGMKAAARLKGQNPDTMPPESFKPPAIWYELPLYYKVNVNSIMGMDDEVAYPEGERFKDYELELAVVSAGKAATSTPATRCSTSVGTRSTTTARRA